MTPPDSRGAQRPARMPRRRRCSNTNLANKAGQRTNQANGGATRAHFEPQVVWQSIDELKNARIHSRKQISQIAASIETFGFTNPALIDADGMIIAGHGRVAAARQLGWTKVPTIRLDHLSENEKRAYIIADNRLAELADWDKAILAVELQNLCEIEVDFAVEITGFETAEIDIIIDGAEADDSDAADVAPDPVSDEAPVSREGDLWQLGDHRVLCGDAREAANYERLLDGNSATMVFTDPPYNVRIDGHVAAALFEIDIGVGRLPGLALGP